MTSFTKMHGIGNDFVVLDQEPPSSEWIAAVCNRHTGVGADGVLAVSAVSAGVVRMQYWNADGSAAEMCDNGLRCVAQYAHDTGLVSTSAFAVETERGRLTAELLEPGLVRVETGGVAIGEANSVADLELIEASVGNPHVVLFVDSVADALVSSVGPQMQAAYPEGVNVEFVERTDSGINVRVWERGVGETLACGSGAVAAAAVSLLPQTEGTVTVNLPGGSLLVETMGGTSWITGSAHTSFKGDLSVVDGVVTAL